MLIQTRSVGSPVGFAFKTIHYGSPQRGGRYKQGALIFFRIPEKSYGSLGFDRKPLGSLGSLKGTSTGVLFGCVARKIDGDSWFTWWFNQPGKPIFSE